MAQLNLGPMFAPVIGRQPVQFVVAQRPLLNMFAYIARLFARSKHTTWPFTPSGVQLGLVPLMPPCSVRKPSHFAPSKRFTTMVSLVAVTNAFMAQITSPSLSPAQPGADVNMPATTLNDPHVEVAVFRSALPSPLV